MHHPPRGSFCTLDKEHFQHRGAGVQQDGLAFGDDGERALLRRRQAAPREPGRPHVNVEEICVVLKKETNIGLR